jgi:hypothetical protein
MPDPGSPLSFSFVLKEEYLALHREELAGTSDPSRDPTAELESLLKAEQAALPASRTEEASEAPEEHEKREEAARRAAIFKLIHGKGHAALCISGGGIRSATFGLGVMQGLAQGGLLDKFHYLSTVSGGGYIGSWLTAWMARNPQGVAAVTAELADSGTAAPGSADHILQPEPAPVRHLRQYSNYLSPRLGLLSADTWTLVATYIRNLTLNWLVFIPILGAILMPPRICVGVVRWAPPPDLRLPLLWLTFAAGTLSAIYAIAYVGLNRPSTTKSKADQRKFLWHCLLPLSLSAVLLTSYWAWLREPDSAAINHLRAQVFSGARQSTTEPSQGPSGDDTSRHEQFQDLLDQPRPTDIENQLGYIFGINLGESWVCFGLFGVLLHLSGWFVYGMRKRPPDGRASKFRYRVLEFVLNLFTGALGGFLAWLGAAKLFPNPSLKSELFVCFAAPLYLVLFLLSLTVFAGISSAWTEDEDREWWARMGGWVLIACVGWAALSSIDIFGPAFLSKLPQYLAPLGGVSGLVTLLLGGGSGSGATNEKKSNGGAADFLKDVAPKLAAPVFAVFVAIGLSTLTSLLLLWLSNRLGLNIDRHFGTAAQFTMLPDGLFHHLKIIAHTPVWLLFSFSAFLLAFAFVLAIFINTNKFSLHAMYRNRLIRAYLGASRVRRAPNLFTGFDPDDNLYAWEVWPNRAAAGKPQNVGRKSLLHVINMALNLVSGEELGWQERKAESFTATALHAGNNGLGYRRTEQYGGPRGMSLGTAVTISGAAANPEMGYHSSPVVSFLLSLFNARLGVWLGNTGKMGNKTFRQQYPPWPMRTMIEEAFGLTNNRGKYVSLSDGGHFDNLGLYEMVLRRCHFIVVSDAGCDPDFNFEDLGGAVRKIRIDFGIPIEFAKLPRLYPRSEIPPPQDARYCAVARIRYSVADGTSPSDDGWLVYIKPAIYKSEPRDVYQYARVNPTFPHQSTADQFFSESQFESYRALGFYEVQQILRFWAGGDFDRLAHHVEAVYLA